MARRMPTAELAEYVVKIRPANACDVGYSNSGHSGHSSTLSMVMYSFHSWWHTTLASSIQPAHTDMQALHNLSTKHCPRTCPDPSGEKARDSGALSVLDGLNATTCDGTAQVKSHRCPRSKLDKSYLRAIHVYDKHFRVGVQQRGWGSRTRPVDAIRRLRFEHIPRLPHRQSECYARGSQDTNPTRNSACTWVRNS